MENYYHFKTTHVYKMYTAQIIQTSLLLGRSNDPFKLGLKEEQPLFLRRKTMIISIKEINLEYSGFSAGNVVGKTLFPNPLCTVADINWCRLSEEPQNNTKMAMKGRGCYFVWGYGFQQVFREKTHSTRKVPDSSPHNEWQPSWNL